MINTIRTRLQERREEAQFRHNVLHKPTLRANLWTAADLTLGQRPAIDVNAMLHYPAPHPQAVPTTRTDWEGHRRDVLVLLYGRGIQAVG